MPHKRSRPFTTRRNAAVCDHEAPAGAAAAEAPAAARGGDEAAGAPAPGAEGEGGEAAAAVAPPDADSSVVPM